MDAHDSSLLVIIVAPGRDGELTCKLLGDAGYRCEVIDEGLELAVRLGDHAGVLVIAQESLTEGMQRQLEAFVTRQPAWSDLPVLVVARGTLPPPALDGLARLGNVSVLVRPMAPESLATAVGSALRARARQLQVRDLLRAERQQAHRKDEFLAMLAHELRNPLQPVRYAAHGLATAMLPPEKVVSTALLIERQVDHMSRLIEKLLDVSRVTRGIIQLDPRPLELGALVREAVTAQAAAAQKRDVALDASLPDVGWIEGDPTRLRQVLDNLIDNAIKFSPPGGRVEVALARDGDQIEITVRDQGDGVGPDVLPFLFEPFTQADRSLDRSRGGLGLGLALVRGLVKLHGGDVSAHSDGAGQGSEFRVRLPAGETPLVEASPADDGRASGRPLRVVVAEDNVDAAEMLRMMLEFSGFEVVVVHSGPEAVDAVRREKPDAVLCDIGLPGITGYDVARKLRADPAASRIVMFAVTGYGSQEDRHAALAAGFDGHFAKPVDPGHLLEALARHAPAARASA